MAPVLGALDQRLNHTDTAPVLVALSGGGDSLALTLMARAWSEGVGRRLIAATVDHQLRPESSAWAAWCEARCRQLGITHITLSWRGPKPLRGLHAAARDARHRLLADAAREAGARVILMGHNRDDVLETQWMRETGMRTPSPRAWGPSPVWPEGRGVFLLRPMLSIGRAPLRAFLVDRGQDWIEDPGNDDLASSRIRARRAIAAAGQAGASVAPPPDLGLPPLAEGAAGELTGEVDSFLHEGKAAAGTWLGTAMVCVGGGDRPPARQSLDTLLRHLQIRQPFAATLAGAALASDGATLVIAREARDRRGSRGADLSLNPDEAMVWDGRFEIRADAAGWTAGFAAGRARRLDGPDRRALRSLPSRARPAAPTLVSPGGRLFCPTLRPLAGVEVRSLITQRLAAGLGAIQHESVIAAWRNADSQPKSL